MRSQLSFFASATLTILAIGSPRVVGRDQPLAASVVSVACPAGPGAMGSSIVTGPDGAHWLSWLEPVGKEENVLKCAKFDSASRTWSEPRRIAQGRGWFINWADFPVLAAQKDRLTAAWFVGSHGAGGHDDHESGYHAEYSVSTDAGKTWSAPQPITTESKSTEFIAFQPLADGRLLAAWLDGRAQKEKRQTLYARVVGGPGPDLLVDPSTCSCCQLSFVPTSDGGALLAYRGRTTGEVRDMWTARFKADRWEAPVLLHADGWKIAGCPVNGPQLAVSGTHAGAVWFTAADGKPRVYAARAGASIGTFAKPAVVDLGRPLGRVDNAVLANGTMLITWLESGASEKEGGIYVRAQLPDGALSAPVLLAPTTTKRASGFPRVTLLSDTGSAAQLLLSFTQDGEPSRVATAIVNIDFSIAKKGSLTSGAGQ